MTFVQISHRQKLLTAICRRVPANIIIDIMENEYFLYYLNHQLKLDPDVEYTIGRSTDNHVMLPHLSVSRLHARIYWAGHRFHIVDMNSTNGIVVNDQTVTSHSLSSGDKLKIGSFNLQFIVRDGTAYEDDFESIADSPTLSLERTVTELLQNLQDPALAAKIIELKQSFDRRREELSVLAFQDTLTLIFNRRYFDAKLVEEVNLGVLTNRPVTLVMIDIDHFKTINDTYGHQKGDEIVRYIAGIICDSVRAEDTVARYGGEELAVILPGVELQTGVTIAERFRAAVEEQVFAHTDLRVTISLGVAQLGSDIVSPEKLVFAADQALYTAKSNGRNQVVAAGQHHD